MISASEDTQACEEKICVLPARESDDIAQKVCDMSLDRDDMEKLIDPCPCRELIDMVTVVNVISNSSAVPTKCDRELIDQLYDFLTTHLPSHKPIRTIMMDSTTDRDSELFW